MDFAAVHSGFVLAAYGVSIVMLTGLVIYILVRDRTLRGEVGRLEEQP